LSALPDRVWSVEEYLASERVSEQRHEYLDGAIYAMAGASVAHNLIVGNTLAALHSQLRQRPCQVYPSDMRVKVKPAKLYTYPDLSVICGQPQLEDDRHDTLLNPTLIVEVLSPSTGSYDRGKKFQYYRMLPSLREYLLIAQDAVHVEHYLRQTDFQWLLTDLNDLQASLSLPSIGCTLSILDVYEKVSFVVE